MKGIDSSVKPLALIIRADLIILNKHQYYISLVTELYRIVPNDYLPGDSITRSVEHKVSSPSLARIQVHHRCMASRRQSSPICIGQNSLSTVL